MALVVFFTSRRSGRELEAAEAELNRSRRLLQTLVDGTTDTVYIKDARGRYLMFNRAAERATGKTAAEVLGRDDRALLAPAEADAVMAGDRAVLEGGRVVTCEEVVTTAHRGPGTVYLSTKGPLYDQAGTRFGLFGIARDVTDRQRAEETIRRSLAEKEVLLREIHHRVKNNLQIVQSILRLSQKQGFAPEVGETLIEINDRVGAMTLVHNLLYRADDLSAIDLGVYLETLAREVCTAHDALKRIRLLTKTASLKVTVDQATQSGLVVTELIINALKHGFPGGRSGELELTVGEAAGRVRIAVANSGVPLPAGFDPARGGALGLKILDTIVGQQLKGDFEIRRDPRTEFIVTFSAGPTGKE